ncbi:nitrate reductase [Aspergillus sp. HF37]|nr:nitrate reductase [Aspergillus sp. HF37]
MIPAEIAGVKQTEQKLRYFGDPSTCLAQTEIAKKADVHLTPRVGTNVALLNGIQYLLFKDGWANQNWMSQHVVGTDELREKVDAYTPQYVEELTGVPAEQLQQAAQIRGTTRSLLSTALQGVYKSNQATAAVCQINNINLLGHIGRPGSGILQMRASRQLRIIGKQGCNGEFPGFRNHMNPVHMQELADLWNIDYIFVPHWAPPIRIENMLSYMKDGSIGMMWISGTNPLVSLSNLARSRQILADPKTFILCQGIFMTETAAIADVVLPATQWGEKTGCFTNADRTIDLSHKAVDPPGQAKPDLDIFLGFSSRMGFKDKDGKSIAPWKTPEEVFTAFRKLSNDRPCDYSSITYEKLTGDSGIQWPCTAEFPLGKERLFEDGVFYTDIEYYESFGHDLKTGAPLSKDRYSSLNPAGRAILKAVDYTPPREVPDKEYPCDGLRPYAASRDFPSVKPVYA